ncbi:MAG: glutamate racemase [Erysipelotrichaceae bacterium]|nr:glutamate racemase [Erysipelotrichaceae bacterium]
MNDRYIGVFDSGLGGLTVVKAIKEAMPLENIVFFADAEHMPYGDKTAEEIIGYSRHNANLLKEYDPKVLAIACNTSDSLARKEVEKLCDMPVIGVIRAACEEAVRQTVNKKIAVLATRATTLSEAYPQMVHELDPVIRMIAVPCPELVPLIEAGRFMEKDKALRNCLKKYLDEALQDHADTLILGCTHYDLLYEMIHEMQPELKIVSSSQTIVKALQAILRETDQFSEHKRDDIYLTSKTSDELDRIAAMIIPEIRFQKK